jgi:hypothetical protein
MLYTSERLSAINIRKQVTINSAGDGYGAHSTNFGDIADKIPPKPSLKASCEKCRKHPDQEGPGYSVCSSCKVSRYCKCVPVASRRRCC